VLEFNGCECGKWKGNGKGKGRKREGEGLVGERNPTTHPTDDIVIICQVRLALLAPKDLICVNIFVIRKTHYFRWQFRDVWKAFLVILCVYTSSWGLYLARGSPFQKF
jgi:hypothetical protein